MARAVSDAERYRAHREAFTLALELGCTPVEAADELRRRAAAKADRAATARLELLRAFPMVAVEARISRSDPSIPRYWWKDRD